MTFEDNFKYHSKEYVFSNDEFLSNQRKDLFKKINLKDFDKKNNESLKNLTISNLTLFDYFYQPNIKEPTVTKNEKNNYKINIVNGLCKNYEDDNIETVSGLFGFLLLPKVTLIL